MGKCKFLREEIYIPHKKITLNFSTHSNEDGVMFYNSILSNRSKKISIKDVVMTINSINLVKEKTIYNDVITFKTLSPIVVREHSGENKSTWYHSLKDEKGQIIFKANLQHQLQDVFGSQVLYDCKDIKLFFSSSNREVKVKNYGIEVLGNIGRIQIEAKPYILEYLYKAGIGSKRGMGFGMVDID
ncbi:CRISPR-associated endoribonuclease Cas6 [Alkalicella caledoniensis]|uniref:CRISPR-associated endoribonuclease Cas6 n=1 Tax=Alkalicella caledoniensis TaxID=2731377 RepID=A0A7G9W4X3_ALKCA|nr:CRISPR-associated endoribonuclease Cas6 [Alkalicella caledoniensis]QNO13735.1 CRISPR-associated endoribonuclease Cas6 [Alkalicella caledoniensis]